MTMIKVIIQPSFGTFKPKRDFERLIDKVGIPLWNIAGRVNEEYVKFVEENAKHGVLEGTESWAYIKIVEVDISRPWTINDYDGQESIKYVDYKFINKHLNYVQFKS
ncbi:TPA: hypothetical protein QCR36_004092 [Bacillus cereus]|nr:hypothetical protein [Bacillus cereus]HDR4742558.1 hypothetical protein [Bacillus cereus]HDR4748145.1 hypothetical protein [Bacillus cereus]HDR4753619.1 hypothetical protein [Bacillus cereus]HDR4770828.1 hypothetical protein [Bacillus cereus]